MRHQASSPPGPSARCVPRLAVARGLLQLLAPALLLAATSSIGAADCPLIGADPPAIDFHVVGVGGTSTRALFISNTGEPGTTLHIETVTVGGEGFEGLGAPGPFDLAAGASLYYPVRARAPSPTHFTGTVTIESSNACNAPLVVPLTMVGQLAPECAAGGVVVGEPGETLIFDASASQDPGGTIVEYAWQFGDGASGTGAVVGHEYIDVDDYTVTLTITDDLGEQVRCEAVALVRDAAGAVCDAGGPYRTPRGVPLRMRAGSALGALATDFLWDLGDGATASGPDVTHVYDGAGPYVATLCVRDVYGVDHCCEATVELFGPECTSGYSYDHVLHWSDLYATRSGAGLTAIGNHVFIADEAGLEVVEIVDGRCVPVGRLDLGVRCLDVETIRAPGTDGKVALVDASGTVWIVDVSRPELPSIAGSLAGVMLPSPSVLAATEGTLFAGARGLTDGAVHVLDVSDVSHPVLVRSLPQPMLQTMSTHPGRLYVGFGDAPYLDPSIGGIRILDIGTPLDPLPVGEFGCGGVVDAIVAEPGAERILASVWTRGVNWPFEDSGIVRSYDVSDPVAPRTISSVGGDFSTHVRIASDGARLFVVAGLSWPGPETVQPAWYVDVHELSAGENTGMVGRMRMHAQVLELQGENLLALSGSWLIVVPDATTLPAEDPSTGVVSAYTSDVAIEGDHLFWVQVQEPFIRTAWVRQLSTGDEQQLQVPWAFDAVPGYWMTLRREPPRLLIHSVESPLLVQEIGAVDFSEPLESDLAIQDDHVFVATGHGFAIVAFDPSGAAQLVGSHDSEAAVSIDVDGDLLVAAMPGGVEIVDVSDPGRPERLARLESLAGAEHVAIEGTIAVCVDPSRSLLSVIDLTNPGAAYVVSSAWVGAPSDVVLHDRRAYLSTGGGVQIVDLTDAGAPRLTGNASSRWFGTAIDTDDRQLAYAHRAEGSWYGEPRYHGGVSLAPLMCSSVPTPVTQVRLDAVSLAEGVSLTWVVGHESEVLRIHVQRSTAGATPRFRRLPEPAAAPGARSGRYVDPTAVAGMEYLYRLEIVDRAGAIEFSDAVRIRHLAGVRVTASAVRPNPVLAPRDRPELIFDLPGAARARVRIYDVAGRLVRALVDAPLGAGRHRITWDLLDERGAGAASGMYLVRLDVDRTTVTRRLIVLH